TRISQVNGLGQLSSVCEVTSATDAAGNAPAACGLDLAATGFLATYQHDALGNLLEVSQGALQPRVFSYDGLSRLLTASNPESGAWSYRYDSDAACAAPNTFAGDLVSRTDARGIRACFQLDALHRVTQRSYSDGTPTALYFFDSPLGWSSSLQNTVGRLSREWVGTEPLAAAATFSYDAMGRASSAQQCTPSNCGNGWQQTAYSFDLAGELLRSAPSVGAATTTGYDLAGRAMSLSSSASGTMVASVERDARGGELSATLGNGVAETRAWDARGRPTAITDGSAYNLSGISYAPNGELLGSTDSVNGEFTFASGDLNQLTEACQSNCTLWENYSFDRYGNRWSQTGNTGAAPPGWSVGFTGGNNRMDGYTYDADGNLLNDGTHTYAYDAENRLISVDGGATASYVYDAEGRRVHESVGGVVKEYVYGRSGQELTVVDANQNLLQGETYFGGRYLGTQTPGGFVYAYADGLGTVRKRSDGTVNTGWPFGEFPNYQLGTSQVQFTGKLFDPETNLSYFGARYYSPSLGRFLTPDWSATPEAVPYADLANPQSLNLYSYVLNNPVSATDPDGHWCLFGWGTTCSKAAPKKLPVKEGPVDIPRMV